MNDLEFRREEQLNKQLVSYEKMIDELAYKYRYAGDKDDIKQEIRLAIVKAYDCFDESKNVPFEAYARICARGAIQQFYLNHHYSMKVTRNVLDRKKKIEDAILRIGSDNPAEISKQTGYSVEQIRLTQISYEKTSLNEDNPVSEDLSRIDLVESNLPNAMDLLERRIQYEALVKCMRRYLSDTEIYVVTHKNGFYCEVLSTVEMSLELGVSHQAVSKMLKKGMVKLKAHLSEFLA